MGNDIPTRFVDFIEKVSALASFLRLAWRTWYKLGISGYELANINRYLYHVILSKSHENLELFHIAWMCCKHAFNTCNANLRRNLHL